MRRNRIYTQDPTYGSLGQTLKGISWVCEGIDYSVFTAAVAYATDSGVRLLTEQLARHPSWEEATKRWLVSLDFGHTEPTALESLASLSRSEVRLPDGQVVVRRLRFQPRVVFHPKLYVFDGARTPLRSSSFGLFIGSANMSLSGLRVGSEAGTAEQWREPIAKTDLRRLREARRQLALLDASWSGADALSSVLGEYKKRRRRRRLREWQPPGEMTEATGLYEPPAPAEVQGDEGVLLRAARAMWVETWELYHNLGPGRPGNQLDLRPGTRVFFGFPPDRVPGNTIIGPVTMTQRSRSPVTKNLRFGNNMMDKLNLPVPGKEGPTNGYDHSFLMFAWEEGPDGTERFRLSTLTRTTLDRRRREAVSERRFRMAGGREYGLLF